MSKSPSDAGHKEFAINYCPYKLRDRKGIDKFDVLPTDTDSILYDTEGSVARGVRTPNEMLMRLERSLWDELFKAADGNDAKKSKVRELITVSRNFLKVTAAASPERRERLVQPYMPSFAPSADTIHKLEVSLDIDGRNKELAGKDNPLAREWIYAALQTLAQDRAGLAFFFLGIPRELGERLRELSYAEMSRLFTALPFRFELRYAETIALNILLEDNIDQARILSSLCFGQIIAGNDEERARVKGMIPRCDEDLSI